VYHQAAIITKATTTKITSAVLLSKPEVTVGDGVVVPVELWAKAGVAKTANAAVGTRILRTRVCICLTRNILCYWYLNSSIVIYFCSKKAKIRVNILYTDKILKKFF